jgi:hypothetical protein
MGASCANLCLAPAHTCVQGIYYYYVLLTNIFLVEIRRRFVRTGITRSVLINRRVGCSLICLLFSCFDGRKVLLLVRVTSAVPGTVDSNYRTLALLSSCRIWIAGCLRRCPEQQTKPKTELL